MPEVRASDTRRPRPATPPTAPAPTTTNHRHHAGGDPAPKAGGIDYWRQQLLDMPDFETEARAIDEDILRLEHAEWVLPIIPPLNWLNLGPKLKLALHGRPLRPPVAISRDDLLPLMEKWRLGIAGEATPTTLASSMAMRATRLQVLPVLLAAFEGYQDDELAVVTVVKPAWGLTPQQLLATSAARLKNQFLTDLKRTGVASVPGPLIGFLDGEFEPTSGLFVLHFQVVTTREKALRLKAKFDKLARTYKHTDGVKRPIKVTKVRNRVRQLSYLIKAFWPEKAVRQTRQGPKRDRNYRRIKEPASTLYLMWLDRQRLADLTIMTGAWSHRKGGSPAMRNLFLTIFGTHRRNARQAAKANEND